MNDDGTRLERDSLGEVTVASSALWGAQTQRSLENFCVGEPMPYQIVLALVWVKKAVARAHKDLAVLSAELADAIDGACDKIIQGGYEEHFPLSTWQTGSGTQTHMNVNEVLANLASESLGGQRGDKAPVHPNDHVNMGQSSNDLFPTAMHVAFAQQLHLRLLPSLDAFVRALQVQQKRGASIIKTGRTHLMDAAPLTYGDVFGGFIGQLTHAREQLLRSGEGILELALGGSAVGTGLNVTPGMPALACEYLSKWLGIKFIGAGDKFSALSGHEAAQGLSASLRTLASTLFKIGNDVRFLASGPRCGIGELKLPENEPGSSIMPGKVNPTQCEALCMICIEVMGYDCSVGFAASQGNFELNVFKPLIASNILKSLDLLSGVMLQFIQKCLKGLDFDRARIQQHLDRSLMLATALNSKLGYDKASKIVRHAHTHEVTLKEAALDLGELSCEEFDSIVDPAKMVAPPQA